jgi:hypothetical protein
MRLLPVIVAAACFCLVAEARTQNVDAVVQAYEAQADDIAAKLLFAEFAKHPDRVHHLAFTFTLMIDAQGRPHNVKITSKTHDRFVEDTARHALAAAKFPPVPKR